MPKEKNDYYVYCWVDDKNKHKPFYVGKGKGLRAEAHDTLSAEEKKESVVQSRINELRLEGGSLMSEGLCGVYQMIAPTQLKPL